MDVDLNKHQGQTIIVVGYPQSGNTWLARLIASTLDSPIVGTKGAIPIAREGDNRKGNFFITQLHLRPISNSSDPPLTTPWLYNTRAESKIRLVQIIRDPRDVAVSANYYWKINNITRAIKVVGEGLNPIGVGSWSNFIDEWRKYDQSLSATVFYRNLHYAPLETLRWLMNKLGIYTSLKNADETIAKAIDAEEINTKRKQIQSDGAKRPYGREFQVRHLRKGIVGDWKNHFTKDDAVLAENYFGEYLQEFGFVNNPNWPHESWE